MSQLNQVNNSSHAIIFVHQSIPTNIKCGNWHAITICIALTVLNKAYVHGIHYLISKILLLYMCQYKRNDIRLQRTQKEQKNLRNANEHQETCYFRPKRVLWIPEQYKRYPIGPEYGWHQHIFMWYYFHILVVIGILVVAGTRKTYNFFNDCQTDIDPFILTHIQ